MFFLKKRVINLCTVLSKTRFSPVSIVNNFLISEPKLEVNGYIIFRVKVIIIIIIFSLPFGIAILDI